MSTPAPLHRTVRMTTAVVGAILAIAGLHHGAFEILQGNRPTPGFFIESIGPEHVRWLHGTDGAFTLLPTFFLAGVATVVVSVACMAWSLFALHRRHGPAGFLGLFVLLTLVGGGIGHIPFFLTAWAYATRIRGSLAGWRRRLGPRVRSVASRAWLPSLLASSLLFLTALELSVFGFLPLRDDPDRLLAVIGLILLSSFVLMNAAYAGAISRDLAAKPRSEGRG